MADLVQDMRSASKRPWTWHVGAPVVVTVLVVPITAFSNLVGDDPILWTLGLWWPLTCLVLWCSVVPLTALVTWILTSHLPTILAISLIVLALGVHQLGPLVPRIGLQDDAVTWFDAHRAGFDEAARLADRACCSADLESVDGDHLVPLPYRLRYLSIDRTVRVKPGGELVFAQWIGVMGHADEIHHRPASYGTRTEPDCPDASVVDLADSWWICSR